MDKDLITIQDFLDRKIEIQERLAKIHLNGRPEIKEIKNKKYIYTRRRELGKHLSEYVDAYSEELFKTVKAEWQEKKLLDKELKNIEKKLIRIGYSSDTISIQAQEKKSLQRNNTKILDTKEKKLNLELFNPKNSANSLSNYLKQEKGKTVGTTKNMDNKKESNLKK